MPVPRRQSIARRGWARDHLLYLAGGYDPPFVEGWGELRQLNDAELSAAVHDMGECYAARRDDIQRLLPNVNRVEIPWFDKYVDDLPRLVVEVRRAG